MSFTPLVVNQNKILYAADILTHQVDYAGNSCLSCYADSIFAVAHLSPTTVYEDNSTRIIPERWSVTRLLKSDVDLPLNTPVRLTVDKVSALRIREDGSSERGDLSHYKFSAVPNRDFSSYLVTKTNK